MTRFKTEATEWIDGASITLREDGVGTGYIFQRTPCKAMYLFVPDTAKHYLGLSPDDLREIADTLEALNKEVLKHA